jgi:hypothetical protein
MVSIKTSGFPWVHTKYQLSDLRFEFLDVKNPSVNPYRKFMVSRKSMFFLPLRTHKQADNFFSKTLLYEKENKTTICSSISFFFVFYF